MNYKFSILTILITCNFIACDIPEYEAKYRFESEEISITGIRQFKNGTEVYVEVRKVGDTNRTRGEMSKSFWDSRT